MGTDRTLHVQVIGGLGSRLRVTVAALAYCQANDRRLVVHWPHVERSEELGVFDCNLSDLYSGPFQETGSDETHWTGARKDAGVLKMKSAKDLFLRTDKIDELMQGLGDAAYCDAWDSLTPSNAVWPEVCNQVRQARTIGVHVRKAMAALECASVEWHLDRLDHIEMVHGDAWSVFLACDARSVRDEFRDRFGDRLLAIDKTFAYDHLGIVRQCVDTHMLWMCDWMIGSNHSSLSQHVALIRGAKYMRDSNHERHVVGGDYEDKTCPPDVGRLAEIMQRS